MNPEEFRAWLAKMAEGEGGEQALARRLGVSLSYVHDVISGRKAPGPGILRPLGIERQYRYVLASRRPTK